MSARSYRILAVDDVLDNLFLLQAILEAEGFSVDVATSGRLALSQIKAHPPDLILLDVMMPEMTGYEVTRHIRQDSQLPTIPILLITAHDEASAVEGLQLGADDFIRKPIDFNTLLLKVRQYLQLERSINPSGSEAGPTEADPQATNALQQLLDG